MMIKVRLTEAQFSVLECNGVFEDLEDRYIPGIIQGMTLYFTPEVRERVWEIINDISNSEDAFAEDGVEDPTCRKLARRASWSASALAGKVLRAPA